MDRLYRLLASLGLLLASTVAVLALLEAATGGAIAPAWSALTERLPATIELAFLGFVAAIALGAIIAFVRTRTHASKLRDIFRVPQLVGRAMPVVALALFLQLFFMFTTSLPTGGMSSIDAFDMLDRPRHLIVPVLSLAVPFGAWSSLIFYDFFRSTDNGVRTSVRNIVGAVAMTAALIGPALLSASLIIEPRFAWPGIARLFYSGLQQFDLGLVAGFLLMYSVGVVLLKLCGAFSPGVPDLTVPRGNGSPRRRKGFSSIGIVASVALLGAAAGALAANLIAPVGPYVIDDAHWSGYPLAPGIAGHALGTDESGRDLLARLLFGLRTSLGIALLAAVIATAIGAVVARAVKRVRWLNGRGALGVTGIRPFAALPFIFAAVTVLAAKFHTVAFLSPLVVALIIAAVSWPAIIPAFRALTPATLGGVIDLTACALLLEVTLSISGFGVQSPTPSLGNILVNSQSNISIAPWAAVYPSVVVVVMLFALYAVAEELREMRGPRERPTGEGRS